MDHTVSNKSATLLERMITAAFAASALGYFLLDHGDPSRSGVLLVAHHIYSVALVSLLIVVCAWVGSGVTRILGSTDIDPLADFLFAFATGAVALALAFLGLGMAGALQPATVLTVFAGLAAVTVLRRAGLAALLNRARRRMIQETTATWLTITAVVLLGMLLLSLAPPSDWDSLMFHLDVPAEFLEAGRVFLPQDNLHVTRVGIPHMLYLPLLAAGSEAAPAILSVLVGAFVGLAILSLGSKYLPKPAGAIGMAAVYGTAPIVLVAATARTDVAGALFVFLAGYAALEMASSGYRKPLALLTGIMIGAAIGTEYTAIPYIVGLALAIAVGAYLARREYRTVAKAIGWMIVGAGITASPWLLKNVLLVGSPLYPNFARQLVEPWLVGLTGQATIVDAIVTFGGTTERFNVLDAFFAPGRLSIEGEGSSYYLSPLLLATPFLLLTLRRRAMLYLVIPALFHVAVVLSRGDGANLRYLIPAAPALTLGVASLIVTLAGRLRDESARRGAILVLVLASLVPMGRVLFRRVVATDAVVHATGSMSRSSYLDQYYDPSVALLMPVVDWANANVAQDSAMVMLFDARGLYFVPTVLQDNLIMNWQLLSKAPALENCLRDTDISHVMLGYGVLNYYLARGADPVGLLLPELTAFQERCLETVYDDGRGFAVFRLKPDPDQ